MEGLVIKEFDFPIQSELGKIIDIVQHSNTETNISGGDSYSYRDVFGYISVRTSPINVSTTTNNIQDIHYSDDHGNEKFIRIFNYMLPLRKDQEIELLYSRINNKTYCVFLKVINTNMVFDISSKNEITESIYKLGYTKYLMVKV